MSNININENTGNGFLFETYDSGGLAWAVDQAMAFYREDPAVREAQVSRIMEESINRFNHAVTAKAYIDIYQQMLQRPLVDEVFEKAKD